MNGKIKSTAYTPNTHLLGFESLYRVISHSALLDRFHILPFVAHATLNRTLHLLFLAEKPAFLFLSFSPGMFPNYQMQYGTFVCSLSIDTDCSIIQSNTIEWMIVSNTGTFTERFVLINEEERVPVAVSRTERKRVC